MTPTAARNAQPDPRRGGRAGGFSLIEVLAVLAILALAATAVMLNARGTETPSLAAETDAFVQRVAAARDMALARNRAVRVVITAESYETRVRTRAGWVPPEKGPELHPWQPGTSVRVDGAELPADILFDSIGSTLPLSLTLAREGRAERVVLDGSGNIRRGER